MKKILLATLLAANTFGLTSQSSLFDEFPNLFSVPKNYVVTYAGDAPVIDGNIEDRVWQKALWTDDFQDIEGESKPKPYYKTRAKMLWDSTYLYIAAELEDKHIWAYLNEHDQVVFYDNDFEVFIDPSNTTHRYFEIEINALNTIFDLFLPKPYRVGSPALISWNSKGLKNQVQIYGSLNDPSNQDQKWTVEMAIPFSDISLGNNTHIPKDNEIWRLNFSRVQWETEPMDGKYVKKRDPKGKVLPENNWVWSPQGIIDMHAPERWGYIQFSTKSEVQHVAQFKLPYSEQQRSYLWLVYYKQQKFRSAHKGQFARTLKELKMPDKCEIDGKTNLIRMEATSVHFSVVISDDVSKQISINNEGLIR